LLSALFAVIAFKTIDSATVGFSVTYALSITQTLNWMVRMSCDIEANIVSVERVKEVNFFLPFFSFIPIVLDNS